MPIDYIRRVHRKRDTEERLESSEKREGDDDLRVLHCYCHSLIPPLPPRRHYAAVPHAHTDTGSPFHDQDQSSEAP